MKAKVKLLDTDVKVWCASCCIRIAPNEERTVFKGQMYHTPCYAKLLSAGFKRKNLEPRRRFAPGN